MQGGHSRPCQSPSPLRAPAAQRHHQTPASSRPRSKIRAGARSNPREIATPPAVKSAGAIPQPSDRLVKSRPGARVKPFPSMQPNSTRSPSRAGRGSAAARAHPARPPISVKTKPALPKPTPPCPYCGGREATKSGKRPTRVPAPCSSSAAPRASASSRARRRRTRPTRSTRSSRRSRSTIAATALPNLDSCGGFGLGCNWAKD